MHLTIDIVILTMDNRPVDTSVFVNNGKDAEKQYRSLLMNATCRPNKDSTERLEEAYQRSYKNESITRQTWEVDVEEPRFVLVHPTIYPIAAE